MCGGFFVRRFTSWVFVNCYEKNQKTLAEVTRKKNNIKNPKSYTTYVITHKFGFYFLSEIIFLYYYLLLVFFF